MKKIFTTIGLILMTCALSMAQTQVYDMAKFGIKPNKKSNMSAKLQKALKNIKAEAAGKTVVLNFEKGTYNFYPQGAAQREYYISNHDQDNPKTVGFPLEDFENLTIEGNGADFIFHGVMLPVSLLRSSNCTLKNFSVDFADPTIIQVKIVNVDDNGTVFEPAEWNNCRITKEKKFEGYGMGWNFTPVWGIAFEEKSKHVVYTTSDIGFPLTDVVEVEKGCYLSPKWIDKRLTPGTVVAMRSFKRPTPGVFLSHNKNTVIENVKVHYAFGMGLLAQLCENITLDGFGVCLRGDDDPRYFTTQADATHFSGCKGKITSVNGLYEGMMDDAINVHGTYLKVIKKIDEKTYIGKYMHGQAYGFDWGYVGDSVQFIKSETMEEMDGRYAIKAIEPHDKSTVHGAKEFKITFDHAIEGIELDQKAYGMENLTWTPEVYFAGNTIRNNRARGSLFSTPKKTVVENNLFDHTSGTAILLCGDCNGWYETGSCHDVVIRNNKFVNALTSMFQFTNAVISIYPEIPNLKAQVKYFHGGKKGAIRIENNEFDKFDAPVLYAKSVNGLIFKNNTIRTNNDFKPFHWNQSRFLLERVTNAEIE